MKMTATEVLCEAMTNLEADGFATTEERLGAYRVAMEIIYIATCEGELMK